MSNPTIRSCVEQAYDEFIKRSFLAATENAIVGETNAAERFNYAVKVATKLKDEILKGS